MVGYLALVELFTDLPASISNARQLSLGKQPLQFCTGILNFFELLNYKNGVVTKP